MFFFKSLYLLIYKIFLIICKKRESRKNCSRLHAIWLDLKNFFYINYYFYISRYYNKFLKSITNRVFDYMVLYIMNLNDMLQNYDKKNLSDKHIFNCKFQILNACKMFFFPFVFIFKFFIPLWLLGIMDGLHWLLFSSNNAHPIFAEIFNNKDLCCMDNHLWYLISFGIIYIGCMYMGWCMFFVGYNYLKDALLGKLENSTIDFQKRTKSAEEAVLQKYDPIEGSYKLGSIWQILLFFFILLPIQFSSILLFFKLLLFLFVPLIP